VQQRRADLPLVISYCGDDLNGTVGPAGGTTLKSMVIVLLSQLAAFRADAIICKSDRLRDRLWRGKDRRRAHVIPNGVDLARFCPGDRSAARRELGLDPDERLVFFPHPRQEPVKRFDLAEAAIASLAASGMKARLWVPDKVPHARMPLHYQAADCLLLVSDREGSPNAVKEALCCDLPVVSVDVGDVPGWVSLAPGSQLVERTPESIASGIRQVLERGGRADGSEIRQRVGMDAIAEQVMTVYRNACARR
jgi:glycosyltransferase involved in cell wall biosynthesis